MPTCYVTQIDVIACYTGRLRLQLRGDVISGVGNHLLPVVLAVCVGDVVERDDSRHVILLHFIS